MAVVQQDITQMMDYMNKRTRQEYDRMLTNTLSHELLTPLNCIINLTEFLKEGAASTIKTAEQQLLAQNRRCHESGRSVFSSQDGTKHVQTQKRMQEHK